MKKANTISLKNDYAFTQIMKHPIQRPMGDSCDRIKKTAHFPGKKET